MEGKSFAGACGDLYLLANCRVARHSEFQKFQDILRPNYR